MLEFKIISDCFAGIVIFKTPRFRLCKLIFMEVFSFEMYCCITNECSLFLDQLQIRADTGDQFFSRQGKQELYTPEHSSISLDMPLIDEMMKLTKGHNKAAFNHWLPAMDQAACQVLFMYIVFNLCNNPLLQGLLSLVREE